MGIKIRKEKISRHGRRLILALLLLGTGMVARDLSAGINVPPRTVPLETEEAEEPEEVETPEKNETTEPEGSNESLELEVDYYPGQLDSGGTSHGPTTAPGNTPAVDGGYFGGGSIAESFEDAGATVNPDGTISIPLSTNSVPTP